MTDKENKDFEKHCGMIWTVPVNDPITPVFISPESSNWKKLRQKIIHKIYRSAGMCDDHKDVYISLMPRGSRLWNVVLEIFNSLAKEKGLTFEAASLASAVYITYTVQDNLLYLTNDTEMVGDSYSYEEPLEDFIMRLEKITSMVSFNISDTTYEAKVDGNRIAIYNQDQHDLMKPKIADIRDLLTALEKTDDHMLKIDLSKNSDYRACQLRMFQELLVDKRGWQPAIGGTILTWLSSESLYFNFPKHTIYGSYDGRSKDEQYGNSMIPHVLNLIRSREFTLQNITKGSRDIPLYFGHDYVIAYQCDVRFERSVLNQMQGLL